MALSSKVTSDTDQSEMSHAQFTSHQTHRSKRYGCIDVASDGIKPKDLDCLQYDAHTQTSSEICTSGRLAFRGYQMFPTARLLLRDGAPVNLGSRAFDLLHLLISSRGNLVSKASILQHVWPDTYVDESNLRFQMGSLRKALGPDRNLIITIPGRGYLFAEDVPNL